jgi:hypothetical protein
VEIQASLKSGVAASNAEWAVKLRARALNDEEASIATTNPKDDLAFYGSFSLINTDQGVRGYLQVVNDLCYLRASTLRLNRWLPDERTLGNHLGAVDRALQTLDKQDFTTFVTAISESLVSFDWRTSSAPDLEESTRRAKLVFRGSGGYKELRAQLLEHLAKGDDDIANAATRLVGGS